RGYSSADPRDLRAFPTRRSSDLHDGRPRGGRRRVVRVAALVAALAVVAGGGVAAERAHKVVTLDVDGQVVQVTSFAGSVSGLLRSEEHTSELQSRENLVCRLLLE